MAKDAYMRMRALERALHPANSGSITICGFFSDPRGVAQSARLSAEALQEAGLPVIRHDIGALLVGHVPAPPPGEGGLLIVHANPPETGLLLRAWPTSTWARRYRVGYWVWELSLPPRSWRGPLDWVDEVWTPSRFSADALARLGRADKVRVMPHPVRPAEAVPDRAAFGLQAHEIVVLTAFDFRSTRARKNPDGAIAAYLAAQPEPGRARLLVKALAPDADPDGARTLAALAARRPDVTIIDHPLSDQGMSSLLASVDILLSLHRSEGFGLLPAQAMAQGKAVLVTGWSGVMDYVDAESAALAPYHLVPARDPSGLYQIKNAQWAEPDIDVAAAMLRELIESPAARKAIGDRAKQRIATSLGGAFGRNTISPRAAAWIAPR